MTRTITCQLGLKGGGRWFNIQVQVLRSNHIRHIPQSFIIIYLEGHLLEKCRDKTVKTLI